MAEFQVLGIRWLLWVTCLWLKWRGKDCVSGVRFQRDQFSKHGIIFTILYTYTHTKTILDIKTIKKKTKTTNRTQKQQPREGGQRDLQLLQAVSDSLLITMRPAPGLGEHSQAPPPAQSGYRISLTFATCNNQLILLLQDQFVKQYFVCFVISRQGFSIQPWLF